MYLTNPNIELNTQAGTNPHSATNSGALTYSTGVVVYLWQLIMSRERKNHTSALEACHTQEGITIGLSQVIIVSVPNQLIVEFENKDTFYDNGI